jgi:hypothetical protein
MRKYVVTAVAITVLAVSMIAPAFAAEGSASSKAMKPKVDTVCVSVAVAAREQSIQGNFGKFTGAVMTAYTARASALSSAWAMPEAKQRNAAIKAAWDGFGKAKKAAKTQWAADQKSAWGTFKTAAKACKADVSSESAGSASDLQF